MVSKVATAMEALGYKDRYDLVSVAGGALSVGMDERAHLDSDSHGTLSMWEQTIRSHIGLAQKLHEIDEVWFIDHEDCGAYHHFHHNKEADERAQHRGVLQNVRTNCDGVTTRTFWMRLDGTLFELRAGEWMVRVGRDERNIARVYTMEGPEDMAVDHLINLLEKRDFKRKLVAKLNKNLDLPMFDERTEKKIIKAVYDDILEALRETRCED